jgi:hypothetical protein
MPGDAAAITAVSGSSGQCPGERWDCKPSSKESAHNVPVLHRHDTSVVHVDPGSSLITHAVGVIAFVVQSEYHTRHPHGATL